MGLDASSTQQQGDMGSFQNQSMVASLHSDPQGATLVEYFLPLNQD